MSFNLKHYVAAGLGFAVCAAFVLHRPAVQSMPVAFQSESGVLSPLSSLGGFRSDNPSPIAKKSPPAFSEPQFASEIPAGKRMDQIDQIGIANEDNDNDFAWGQLDDDTSLELAAMMQGEDHANSQNNIVQQESFSPVEFGSIGELELELPAVTDTASGSRLDPDSLPLHADRPNSRWKRNPFMDQAGQLAAATPARKPDYDSESTIIVEPIEPNAPKSLLTEFAYAPREAHAESHGSNTQPRPADRSVLLDFDDDANPTAAMARAQRVTPDMPMQLEEMNRIPSAGFAPTQLEITEAVALQAVHHIEYGKTLARRGATLAAEQEFLSALRVVAHANDAMSGSNEFSVALAQAVLAMREAQEFASPNVEALMIAEVSRITESHQSNIISPTQAARTTPTQAMQKYFSFAKQKLDEAGGRNVVTGEALFCLGKLHTSAAVNKSVPDKIDIAKAITYHQAALLSDKKNYRSANELGVLMARTGQLAEATTLFKQSLIVNPTPETWKNLAKAHRRLGQTNLAQLADVELALAAQTKVANSSSRIQWMPTTRFNESAPMEFSDNTRVASTLPADEVEEKAESKTEPNDKSFGERLKDLF